MVCKMPLLALKQYFYDPVTLLCLCMWVFVCEQAISGKRQELHKYSMVKLSVLVFPIYHFIYHIFALRAMQILSMGEGDKCEKQNKINNKKYT